MSLQNKIVLVTGGASGIGRATVDRLASDGAHVVVADMHADGAASAAAEVQAAGGSAEALELDVTDHGAVAAAIADIAASHGRLDGAFNNAGIGGPTAKVTDIDPAKRRVKMDCHCSVEGKKVLIGEATVLAPSRKFD